MQTRKVEMIPLNELGSSKKNARRTGAGEAKHRELMASILAHDVLSSLVVRKVDKPKEGAPKYAVIAGERRLRALHALAEGGEITETHAIPCHVRRGKASDDFEVSLAENTVRAEMNPIDKYEGYRELAEAGKSPAEIAKAFGTTARAVEQFLRLADVHEEILDAARQERIKPAALMAFAASSDKSRQLLVWKQASEHYGEPNPAWIRSEMLREHLAASHGRVRFVGVEAYEQAGGRIERDLFAEDDDEVFLTDVKLIDELATRRLDAIKSQLEQEWGWATASFNVRYDELAHYGRIEGVPGALKAEETARVAEIDGEITRLETLLERENALEDDDEGADALEEELRVAELEGNLHGQLQQLRNERRRIQEQRGQRATFDAAQMRHAGVIVTIDEYGQLLKHAGLVREADAANMPAAGQAEAAAEAEPDESGEAARPAPADGGTLAEPEPVDGAPAPTVGPAGTPDNYRPPTRYVTPEDKERAARNASGLGTALFEDMQIVRTSLAKVSLAKDFRTAFDLFTYQGAQSILTMVYSGEKTLNINCSSTATKTYHGDDERNRAVFGETEAMIEAVRAALPLDWMDAENAEERFKAFCALPTRDKQRIFAAVVALTLNPQLAFEYRATHEFERVVERVKPRFAAGFRPTAANFWDRVSKADALAAATHVLGADWAAAHAKDKKSELSAALEAAFAAGDGPPDLTAAQRKRALAWVPPGFDAFATAALDPDVETRPGGDGAAAAPPASGNGAMPDEIAGGEPAEAVNGTDPDDNDDAFDATPAAAPPAFLQQD